MIVNFSFGYGFKPTAEIAEKLNKVLLDQKIEIGENGEIKNGWRNYTADIADIIDIVDVGEIKIVKADSLPLEARLINMIERMSGRKPIQRARECPYLRRWFDEDKRGKGIEQ